MGGRAAVLAVMMFLAASSRADEPQRVRHARVLAGVHHDASGFGIFEAGASNARYTENSSISDDEHSRREGRVGGGEMRHGHFQLQLGAAPLQPPIFGLELKLGPGIYDVRKTADGKTGLDSLSFPAILRVNHDPKLGKVSATITGQVEITDAKVKGDYRQVVPDAPSTPGTRQTTWMGIESGARKAEDGVYPVLLFRVGRNLLACGAAGTGDRSYVCTDLSLVLGVGSQVGGTGSAALSYAHKIDESSGEKSYLYFGPQLDYTRARELVTGQDLSLGRAMFTFGVKAF